MNEKEVLRQAVDKYGSSSQTDMMIEEMSELTKALLKYRRAVRDLDTSEYETVMRNILEEMADVSIMLDQMEILYGSYKQYRKRKIERLERRLNA